MLQLNPLPYFQCYPVVSDSSLVCNTPKLYSDVTVPDSLKLTNIFWVLEKKYRAPLPGITVTVYPNPTINLDNMDKSFAAGESIVIKVKGL